jgi:hypothetical protein
LSLLDTSPPSGYSQWNGRLLSRVLKDVSDDQVWRVLRKHKVQLQRRRSWCISTDPEFTRKAADIVALYLHPPENAVVVCVDEKPHIQVLERAQGWLRLPNGKALNGFNLATAISVMERPPCLLRWRWPPDKCKWDIILVVAGATFWTS